MGGGHVRLVSGRSLAASLGACMRIMEWYNGLVDVLGVLMAALLHCCCCYNDMQ